MTEKSSGNARWRYSEAAPPSRGVYLIKIGRRSCCLKRVQQGAFFAEVTKKESPLILDRPIMRENQPYS